MALGFDLAETISGTYYRHDDALRDRPIRIELRLEVLGLRRFARERRVSAEGTIVAEGLASGSDGRGRPISGELRWKLLDQKRVPYDLAFEGDDGRAYHLRGQRELVVHDIKGSLSTLAASLYDDAEQEIGRAELTFVPEIELPALLRSFRPRFRPAISRG